MTFSFLLLLLIGAWISFEDMRRGRIPNKAIILLLVFLWAHIAQNKCTLTEHCMAGGIGIFLSLFLLPFYYSRKMGFGDLKLFTVGCLLSTIKTLAFFVILSGAIGLVLTLAYRLCVKKKTAPLGPALMLSLIATHFENSTFVSTETVVHLTK